jgi:hypothetical protein
MDEMALYLENRYGIYEICEETKYSLDDVVSYLCRIVYLFMDEIF